MIEQVIEWLALDPYPEAIHVREVRLTKLAWLVPLLEKHFFRWTLERTPLLHPPLQRSKLPVLKLTRVTTLEILEQRLRLKAWFSSSFERTFSHISLNESSRVRQSRSLFISLGSFLKRRYFRAVFSSIPDFAAANDSVCSWFNSFISFLT